MASVLLTITLLFGRTIPGAEDCVSLREAGLAEYEMGHYALAEEFIRKALVLTETNNNDCEVARIYSASADIQQAKRQFANAERDCRKASSLLIHHLVRS